MLTSLGPFFAMNQLVTIPADGLQILNAVGSAMGSVFAMMNLQVTARATPGAAPAILLHSLPAVNEVHAMHERLKCDEVSLADGFRDQLLTLEGPHRAHASLGRQFPNLIARQPFRSFLGHNVLR
jgi:hypothetical protein